MTPYVALTALGVHIVGSSATTRKRALEWAAQEGHRWPGARIVQQTKKGLRTVWKHQEHLHEK